MKRLLAILILLAACDGALACPMCKDSAANGEGQSTGLRDSYTSGGQNITGGLNTSIYVMLGALVAVMGMVSRVIVKGARSSGQANQSSRDVRKSS